MRIVAVIPYWNQYKYDGEGLDDLDRTNLGGRILLNYPIALANKIDLISNTYLFTNDLNISELLDERLKFDVVNRDRDLDNQETSIENVLSSFLGSVQADVVVLMHPRSPFVKKRSIEDCIHQVVSGNYDSAFLGKLEKKFAWYEGKRINYDVKNGTPHLSMVKPILLETSSVYVFTRRFFEKSGTRVGDTPFIRIVGSHEGMTISSAEEIKLAEYLLDSQFCIDE